MFSMPSLSFGVAPRDCFASIPLGSQHNQIVFQVLQTLRASITVPINNYDYSDVPHDEALYPGETCATNHHGASSPEEDSSRYAISLSSQILIEPKSGLDIIIDIYSANSRAAFRILPPIG